MNPVIEVLLQKRTDLIAAEDAVIAENNVFTVQVASLIAQLSSVSQNREAMVALIDQLYALAHG